MCRLLHEVHSHDTTGHEALLVMAYISLLAVNSLCSNYCKYKQEKCAGTKTLKCKGANSRFMQEKCLLAHFCCVHHVTNSYSSGYRICTLQFLH